MAKRVITDSDGEDHGTASVPVIRERESRVDCLEYMHSDELAAIDARIASHPQNNSNPTDHIPIREPFAEEGYEEAI